MELESRIELRSANRRGALNVSFSVVLFFSLLGAFKRYESRIVVSVFQVG